MKRITSTLATVLSIAVATTLVFCTYSCSKDSGGGTEIIVPPVDPEPEPEPEPGGDPIVPDPETGIPFINKQVAPTIEGSDIYFVNATTDCAASLQGLCNQTTGRVFNSSSSYSEWALQVQATGASCKTVSGVDNFINQFAKYATGYILVNDNTTLIGASIAGPTCAIIMSEDDTVKYMPTSKLGLKCLIDVREKDYDWLYDVVKKSMSAFNLNGALQPHDPTSAEPNHIYGIDFAVSSRRIAFRTTDEAVCKKLYSLLNSNSPLYGFGVPYGDEGKDVMLASGYGLYTIPSDWAMNYSFFTSFPVKTTSMDQKAKSLPTAASAHYVMLMFSDGDNLEWTIQNGGMKGSKYMGNSNCAGNKIAWEIPPTLVTDMPLCFKWYAENCPKDNSYIAATSGCGYMYPSKFASTSLGSEASKTDTYMCNAGLDYLAILDLETFSGSVPYLKTMLQNMSYVKGIFHLNYANYAGGAGQAGLINGKPVVSFRYRLWAGLDPYESVATKINAASRDVKSIDAYSAVVAHVWSYGTEDVIKFIDLLDDDVILCTPDEFMKLIQQNVTLSEL